ncbi:hypothetical protein VIGAN_02243700 [Vigna angularis var. angularis]|uniref:Uncharacterized protein n=1 Tax=Vigna angularis var. angularis TaxID=157739 RepID=A0A0S3RGB5_PHAAN|nr:hypothetical protein VIGAN_02243700 [Vigna angularis var. angularis]
MMISIRPFGSGTARIRAAVAGGARRIWKCGKLTEPDFDVRLARGACRSSICGKRSWRCTPQTGLRCAARWRCTPQFDLRQT